MKICFIEDMELEGEVIKRLVGMCDPFEGQFEFDVFGTWTDGAKAVETGAYEIVLVDLGLPDSSTDQTILRVGQMAAHWPPICILTGNVDQELRSRSILLGAEDFVMKNVAHRDPVSLCERLYNAYLRRKRQSLLR